MTMKENAMQCKARLVSIVPAHQGWRVAMLWTEDDEDGNPAGVQRDTAPLIGWAVIEYDSGELCYHEIEPVWYSAADRAVIVPGITETAVNEDFVAVPPVDPSEPDFDAMPVDWAELERGVRVHTAYLRRGGWREMTTSVAPKRTIEGER